MSSATTALLVLEFIAGHQPLGVSELARQLRLSKPTAQRALLTLADTGWIRRSESQPGRWVLTTKPLEVANGIGRDCGLREAARGPMTRLGELTTETVHLAMLDGHEIVTIDAVESTQVVNIHWPIGTRSPAYASANGKAILAALPRGRVREHLPERLRPFTSETISTFNAFEAELDRVAERGYAVQRGEQRPDVASVAAVIGHPRQPVASLSVFMPANRFSEAEEENFGALVRGASKEVSAGLRR